MFTPHICFWSLHINHLVEMIFSYNLHKQNCNCAIYDDFIDFIRELRTISIMTHFLYKKHDKIPIKREILIKQHCARVFTPHVCFGVCINLLVEMLLLYNLHVLLKFVVPSHTIKKRVNCLKTLCSCNLLFDCQSALFMRFANCASRFP